VPFYTPSSGDITEVIENLLEWLEGAVAIVARDVWASVSEADDVLAIVARKVGKEAGVPFHTPSPRVVTEVIDDQLWCGDSHRLTPSFMH
jgi:butyrate kinase